MFGDDSLQPPKYDGNDKSEPIKFGDFAEFFSFVPNKDKPGHERLEIKLFGDPEKLPAMCKYRWQWLQNFREDKMFSDSERDCVLFQIDMRLESIENQYRSRIEVYELFFLYGLGIII